MTALTTGLWAVASGLDPAALAAAIPPACRRTLAAAPAPVVADGEAVVEGPAWPVGGASHFVPSFTMLTRALPSVRLEMSARVAGAWSPWVGGVALGPAAFAPIAADGGGVVADVDVFRTAAPAEAARVRLRLRAANLDIVQAAPWALTLSASDAGAPPAPAPSRAPRLDVPALSQVEADPALGRRICSPTCVAMVLAFWRRPVPPAALAAEIFHPGTDLYGVWPAAILAAARRGVAGYLLRFPDWASAAWCLGRGLPVIASVRYAAGELTGAAIAETAGHLVVLTGCDGEDALVNDPAAPTAAAVPRRYRLAELARVWLERTGVGYVLFPLAA